ncbi:MAG: hypothetical protein ACRC3Z_01855 [Phocaeicola sp.]
MKKTKVILLGACMALVACSDNGEKHAQLHLQRAEQALQAGAFSEAKMEIDSIRTTYPKAFEARKAGIKLMQQVDLQEQRKSLAYLDSMKVVKQAEFEAMKGAFVLEKDETYQEVGNYFYPTQVVEKSAGRTFLRGQVTEQGTMSVTSIYCAGGKLNHSAVKVTVGDLYAETPQTADGYTTTDLGKTIERVDYKYGSDGGVIDFIAEHQADNIRLHFLGAKSYAVAMDKSDRKAIAELRALAAVLSSLEQIDKERKEAQLKIEFVLRKMNEASVE